MENNEIIEQFTSLDGKKSYKYIHDGYAAKICHGVKDGNKEAIKEMALFLASQIHQDCALVPVPQHSGKAIYTLEIAQIIKEELKDKYDIEICDILKTTPHKSLYEQKSLIVENNSELSNKDIPSLENGKLFFSKSLNNTDKPFYFVDNIISTGRTYDDIVTLFNKIKVKIEPLVFTISPKYQEKHPNDFIDEQTIKNAQNALEEITHPILAGSQTGLWTAFNDFKEYGIFDIIGKQIETVNDKITENGFRQLAAALEIYRDKRFETFRYIFVNKDGTLNGQLTLCATVPDKVIASTNKLQIVEKVLSYAEKTDTNVVLVHNHPSGRVEPSRDDIRTTDALLNTFTNKNENCRLAGHIILDHSKFSLGLIYKYSNRTYDTHWATMDTYKTNLDPLLKENNPYKDFYILSPQDLPSLVKQINKEKEWKDKKYATVVFIGSDNYIHAMKKYPKSWFNKSVDIIKEEFKLIGSNTGSNLAIPIVYDKGHTVFEDRILTLQKKGAFTDFILYDKNQYRNSEYYNIGLGQLIFENDWIENNEDKVKIESTFKQEINTSLFSKSEGDSIGLIANDSGVDNNYIYSKEFKSKFGDWEKANRLEKLKNSNDTLLDKALINADIDKNEFEILKKENLTRTIKKLVIANYDNQRDSESKLKIHLPDRNIDANLSVGNIKHLLSHQLLVEGQIEAALSIQEIANNAIYIDSDISDGENQNKDIKTYDYFMSGAILNGKLYTIKSVVGYNALGEARYYDQRATNIKKELYINNLSLITNKGEIDTQLINSYDMRLIYLCQVPQLPYMELNPNTKQWLPTKETIQKVKEDKLYIQKKGQIYQMIDLSPIQKITNQEELLYSPNGKKSNLSLEDYNFVRSPEFKAIAGEWEYKAAAEFALKTENVAIITGSEFQKEIGKSIIDNVLQYYKSVYDGKIEKNNIGTVILDKEGIKDSLAHGMTKTKAAAYAVVPAIIQNGYLYNREKNWKGRNYDTAVLIASVSIGGVDYVGEVILKQRPNKTGFYLHEVELKTKLAGMFKTPTKGSISTSSHLIITRHLDKVNNCNISFDENFEPSKEDIEKIKKMITHNSPIQKITINNSNLQEKTMENTRQKKITLKDILELVEFDYEIEDGKINLIDTQGAYLGDAESYNEHTSMESIIDRLYVYYNDYLINDINNTLYNSDLDIDTSNIADYSWEELRNFIKENHLEDKIDGFSYLEAIVNPESLIENPLEELKQELENLTKIKQEKILKDLPDTLNTLNHDLKESIKSYSSYYNSPQLFDQTLKGLKNWHKDFPDLNLLTESTLQEAFTSKNFKIVSKITEFELANEKENFENFLLKNANQIKETLTEDIKALEIIIEQDKINDKKSLEYEKEILSNNNSILNHISQLENKMTLPKETQDLLNSVSETVKVLNADYERLQDWQEVRNQDPNVIALLSNELEKELDLYIEGKITEEQLEAGSMKNFVDTIETVGDFWKEDYIEYATKEKNVLGTTKFASEVLKDTAFVETILEDDGINQLNKIVNDNIFIKQQAQNWTIDKLKNAGIEVISNKEEFNKILESKEILQKLTKGLTDEQINKYFTFNEEDVKRFNETLDKWGKEPFNSTNLLVIGKIPPIMKALGIADLPIEIEQRTISKILSPEPLNEDESHGHNLQLNDVRKIPDLLADPVMIFNSLTQDNSYVFFTEKKDDKNRSVIIPLRVEKRKNRIVINEVTSMYGRNNELMFVKRNIEENAIVYLDKLRSFDWLNKLSQLGESITNVQFVGQGITDLTGYNSNILTKDRLVNFLAAQNLTLSNGTTYGFAHEGKIYLNPDVINSQTPIHEYTHLWDNYIQNTNTELWNKGLEAFKDTTIWNEVINDPYYADIKDDENLVLSECHARITGKVAEKVLERIAKENGEIKKDEIIDWNKETWQYIAETYSQDISKFVSIKDFIEMPMKDLMNGMKPKKELLNWVTQELYEEADGLEPKEIYEKYDNKPIPIAEIPERARVIFQFGNVKDFSIYSGKAYFIDHMVNHHSELDISEYQEMQNDLDSFDHVYLDNKNQSIVFEKERNNKKYSIAVKEDLQGHLIFYKSYHSGTKTKTRFIEIDCEKLKEKLLVEVGNSSINHPEITGFGRLLSALTNNNNINNNNSTVNQKIILNENSQGENTIEQKKEIEHEPKLNFVWQEMNGNKIEKIPTYIKNSKDDDELFIGKIDVGTITCDLTIRGASLTSNNEAGLVIDLYQFGKEGYDSSITDIPYNYIGGKFYSFESLRNLTEREIKDTIENYIKSEIVRNETLLEEAQYKTLINPVYDETLTSEKFEEWKEQQSKQYDNDKKLSKLISEVDKELEESISNNGEYLGIPKISDDEKNKSRSNEIFDYLEQQYTEYLDGTRDEKQLYGGNVENYSKALLQYTDFSNHYFEIEDLCLREAMEFNARYLFDNFSKTTNFDAYFFIPFDYSTSEDRTIKTHHYSAQIEYFIKHMEEFYKSDKWNDDRFLLSEIYTGHSDFIRKTLFREWDFYLDGKITEEEIYGGNLKNFVSKLELYGNLLETKTYIEMAQKEVEVLGTANLAKAIKEWQIEENYQFMEDGHPGELDKIIEEVQPKYFVKSTAEFEQFADFEPITNLTAKEAVAKFVELGKKDIDCGIGIHIPNDFVFHDPNAEGAIVFNKIDEHHFSFFPGDSFVKELSSYDKHAKNVINAFKELDEELRKSQIEPGYYEQPNFIYEKENELIQMDNTKSLKIEEKDIFTEFSDDEFMDFINDNKPSFAPRVTEEIATIILDTLKEYQYGYYYQNSEFILKDEQLDDNTQAFDNTKDIVECIIGKVGDIAKEKVEIEGLNTDILENFTKVKDYYSEYQKAENEFFNGMNKKAVKLFFKKNEIEYSEKYFKEQVEKGYLKLISDKNDNEYLYYSYNEEYPLLIENNTLEIINDAEKVEKIVNESTNLNVSFIEKAKELIDDFTFNSSMSTATFEDIEHIGLAYTTSESEELQISVEANLKELTISTYVYPAGIDDYTEEHKITTWHLNSENDYIDALRNLDFDNLTSIINDKEALQEAIGFKPQTEEEQMFLEDVKNIIEENNLDVVITNIKRYEPVSYPQYNPDGVGLKDAINVLVEFTSIGDFVREDDFFEMLNEENTSHVFNGKPIDYNPITAAKSGSIETYLERLNKDKLYEKEREVKEAKNWAIDKLHTAGIEVISNKEEFNKILESEKLLQKMSFDLSEIEELQNQLNEEKEKSKYLNYEKENKKTIKLTQEEKDFNEVINFVKSVKDYIPMSNIDYNKPKHSPGGEFVDTNWDYEKNGLTFSNNDVIYNIANFLKPYFVKNNDENIYLIQPVANDQFVKVIGNINDTYLYKKLNDFFNDMASHRNFEPSVKIIKEDLVNKIKQNITLESQYQNKIIQEIVSLDSKIKKEISLPESMENDFAALDKSLRFNANFEIKSSKLGENVSVFPGSTGKHGLGIRHLIEQRYKNDNLSIDEITALTGLVLDSVRNGEITRKTYNQTEFTKNGIIAIVRQDYFGQQENWVLTGFAYDETNLEKNREATEAIKTVNAKYSQSQDYSYFRNQVGAVVASLDLNISDSIEKSSIQNMTLQDGTTYGFTHEGKIYLNPDVINSQTPIHEYTHLWDNYIQNTNSELWNKGLEAFKDTTIWNEVINDPYYADIKDDENLVLSECHARITGKVAEKVLERIAQENGEIKKDEIIDWNKETWQYIAETYSQDISKFVSIKDFIEMPMKDLIEGKDIIIEQKIANEKQRFDFEININETIGLKNEKTSILNAAYATLNKSIDIIYEYKKEFENETLVDKSCFYKVDKNGIDLGTKKMHEIDFKSPNWKNELKRAAYNFAQEINISKEQIMEQTQEKEPIEIIKQSFEDFIKDGRSEDDANVIKKSFEQLNATPLFVYYDNNNPNAPEFIISQLKESNLYITHQLRQDDFVTGHYDISTLETAQKDCISRTCEESTPLGKERVNFILKDTTINLHDPLDVSQQLEQEKLNSIIEKAKQDAYKAGLSEPNLENGKDERNYIATINIDIPIPEGLFLTGEIVDNAKFNSQINSIISDIDDYAIENDFANYEIIENLDYSDSTKRQIRIEAETSSQLEEILDEFEHQLEYEDFEFETTYDPLTQSLMNQKNNVIKTANDICTKYGAKEKEPFDFQKALNKYLSTSELNEQKFALFSTNDNNGIYGYIIHFDNNQKIQNAEKITMDLINNKQTKIIVDIQEAITARKAYLGNGDIKVGEKIVIDNFLKEVKNKINTDSSLDDIFKATAIVRKNSNINDRPIIDEYITNISNTKTKEQFGKVLKELTSDNLLKTESVNKRNGKIHSR